MSTFEIPAGCEVFPASAEKVSLGAAIYPTLALLNHSCNPDFMRCNRGKGIVCVANRDIKKGIVYVHELALAK